MSSKKIGVIVGREWSFPPAFIEEVNSRNAGVVAEYAKLGGTKMNEPCEYAVLVDRISHEIPYYRTYLKNAMLQGAYCINNPFQWSADDKFFGAGLITRLGLTSPKTMALPMKAYPEGVVSESLRNLVYPLDWDAIVALCGAAGHSQGRLGRRLEKCLQGQHPRRVDPRLRRDWHALHDPPGIHRVRPVRPLHLRGPDQHHAHQV